MTSPKFKKYPSIENDYRNDYMKKVYETISFYHNNWKKSEVNDEIEWVSSEKVHGSNFSFIVTSTHSDDDDDDQVSIAVGKRSGLIEHGDKYFPQATATVRKKYESACRSAFQLLKQEFLNDEKRLFHVNQVIVFGELFGGQYGKKIQGRVPIQKEVHYCDEFDFYAFDVFVSGKMKQAPTENIDNDGDDSDDNDEDEGVSGNGGGRATGSAGVWLTFDEAIQLFESAGFHVYSKPILRGKLSELLASDVCFDSTLPQTFYPHLEPLQPGTNICEGVVIKPANVVLHLSTGDRVLIKKKNSKFLEVSAPKAKPPPSTTGHNTAVEPQFATEEGKMAYEDSMRYITEQRLNNCESKIGHLSRSTVGKLIGALGKDALEDFVKDNAELWSHLKKEDQRKITKKLAELAKKMVSEQFSKANTF